MFNRIGSEERSLSDAKQRLECIGKGMEHVAEGVERSPP